MQKVAIEYEESTRILDGFSKYSAEIEAIKAVITCEVEIKKDKCLKNNQRVVISDDSL